MPTTPPPPPVKVKLPEPPKITPPEPPKLEVKLDTPKIVVPKPLPKPEPKPVQMEAKLDMPVIKTAKPSVVLAPQPKAALQRQCRHRTTWLRLRPRRYILARHSESRRIQRFTTGDGRAIGNPYGGLQGQQWASRVVGSTGMGNGLKSGSNAGTVGSRIGWCTGDGGHSATAGKVASAGIPKAVEAAPVQQVAATPQFTSMSSFQAARAVHE